jgi:hypothetical protein
MEKGGPLPKGYQAHHVIPKAVWKDIPEKCQDKLKLDVHAAYNGIALPGSVCAQRARGRNERAPIHNTNHTAYSKAVRNKLQGICSDIEEGKFDQKAARMEMFAFINESKNNLLMGIDASIRTECSKNSGQKYRRLR